MSSVLTLATVALGFFASGALAGAFTDVDATTTETQEIGSTTSEGAIWYSMNVCEIIQHTQCDVSLSQGGAAPPEETGGTGNYPPPGEPKPSAPASGEPEYSHPPAGDEPVPTEGGEQPPPSEGSDGGEPAPTEGGGEQPPQTDAPKPTEGEGGDKPAPTALVTTNEAGEETTIPGTLVPATTSGDGSVVPSGSATEEHTGPTTTAGALSLMPAAVPALAFGAMALLMIAI